MSSTLFFAIMKGMKSYNTLNDYYRTLFGEKTFKVPIDAGFDLSLIHIYGDDETIIQGHASKEIKNHKEEEQTQVQEVEDLSCVF